MKNLKPQQQLKELNVGVQEKCKCFWDIANERILKKVIQKAKEACHNAGEYITNHFPDIRKTILMKTIKPQSGGMIIKMKHIMQINPEGMK